MLGAACSFVLFFVSVLLYCVVFCLVVSCCVSLCVCVFVRVCVRQPRINVVHALVWCTFPLAHFGIKAAPLPPTLPVIAVPH